MTAAGQQANANSQVSGGLLPPLLPTLAKAGIGYMTGGPAGAAMAMGIPTKKPGEA